MKLYSVSRVYKVFKFLLTIYLVIKKRDTFLGLKPLKPKELKHTIITLGASFIKLAQVLATRADFFSEEYLDELKQLHDKLPSMNKQEFKTVYNRAFNKTSFKSFDETPIASASIGQVHIAYLENDVKVAVKLRREGIKQRVLADIKIINFFNFIFKPLFSYYTKNSIEAVIKEFSSMIKEEVSLSNELQNLKKFSKTYEDSKIKFPIPYEEISSDDALVMSFEEGFRFDDKKSILENNIDFKEIISTLVNFYTEQMLIKGYFHADPHPGNLLITKDNEIILLDFGMVKTVPNNTRIAIIELIKAANEQDYESYINASKKLGTVAYEAPTSQLAEFTSKMFDIFSNNNLNSESMQKLAFEVLESTRDLPFKLPSDAIYILRVSAIIEGLGTTYIENFNGIKDILPILKDNLPKALGSKDSLVETVIDELKDIPFIIKNFKSTMKKASEGELKVEISDNQLEYLRKEVTKTFRSYFLSFSLMLGSLLLLLINKSYEEIAIVLFIFAITRIIYK
ncbi:ABC1 kinase family protein [Arcobacter sp. CECT 8986]|uniref:ABC1 kinase family protein n=1 Tax=Arcobacter sp. CECT 8986 TaxID=2044507 RepID=UPI0035BF3371